jgi:hypothetical protein
MSALSRRRTRTVLASAADARYGRWLLNLVGSVQRTSDGLFDLMIVYDLGLTRFQRRLLDSARGVQVRHVPPFVPHWRGGRTWKTWIWTHTEAETILWLDAGTTVIRPLVPLLDGIEQRGYFVVSTGVPNGPSTPSDYYGLYGLGPDFAEQIAITAGILGFSRGSSFYTDVIEPTFEDAVLGRNLGFSEREAPRLNWGLDELERVVVRDCEIFRHEQTLLNIHFYRSTPEPHVSDLFTYGGFRSPHDAVDQVIWNHRRRGDYRFLPSVRYVGAAALLGLPWGAGVYLRELANRYRWLLRPSFHARVARRLLAATGLARR